MSVQCSIEASRDLEEVKNYISRDSPEAAVRLILPIREKCALPAQQPGIGRDRSDILSGLRGFPSATTSSFSTNERWHCSRSSSSGARDIPELFD
jgi:plasmid stabilization system protein ParE